MAKKWLINETITSLPEIEKQFNTNFISNNNNFSLCILNRDYDEEGESAEAIVYDDIVVWVNYDILQREGNWTDEAYRTITFETAPTGDLLAWLQANATPIEDTGFSIDLTSLTGWDTLSTGTHNIQVKAKATGYLDSDLSESVSVEKAVSAGYKVTITYTSWWDSKMKIDDGEWLIGNVDYEQNVPKDFIVQNSVTLSETNGVNDGGYYIVNGIRTDISGYFETYTIPITQDTVIEWYIEED